MRKLCAGVIFHPGKRMDVEMEGSVPRAAGSRLSPDSGAGSAVSVRN